MIHECPLEYLTPELGHHGISFLDDYNGFPTSDLDPLTDRPYIVLPGGSFLNLTCLTWGALNLRIKLQLFDRSYKALQTFVLEEISKFHLLPTFVLWSLRKCFWCHEEREAMFDTTV